MAKFPIVEARQKLGFTPTRAVRADIDVRTGEGEVGAAIGQALVKAGELGIRESARKQAIRQKNRVNLDSLSKRQADELIKQRNQDIIVMQGNTPPEKWEEKTILIVSDFNGKIGELDFSPEALAEQQITMTSDEELVPEKSFIAASKVISAAAVKSAEEMLTDAYRLDLPDLPQRNINFINILKNSGIPAKAITSAQAIAKAAGEKLKVVDNINIVHAAIEAGSKSGDFETARVLATNPLIPESKQATLRTAIETAENKIIAEAKAAQTALINTTTSDTIRESYQGTLTVAELDKRHEAGLIKDANFESMRKSLAEKIPEISDPLVRSEMSNAVTQFKAGQISEQEAQIVFLDSLPFLDEPDRKKFDNDIAATSIKLVETGMANAKRAGDELISPQFRTAKGEIVLPDFTGKRAKQERADAERKLNLELRLRNQYYDALDEWKESQVGKDITNRDIRRIENDLLIEYRKIKTQELDKLEAAVRGKEEPTTVPQPITESRSLRQLKTDQLKARREELRKQLR